MQMILTPSSTQGKYQHFNLSLLYFLSFVFVWFVVGGFSPFDFIFSQDSSLPSLYTAHFDRVVYRQMIENTLIKNISAGFPKLNISLEIQVSHVIFQGIT